jgi:hypothetical protein
MGHAKMQMVQDQSQSSVDNLRNVRLEVSRYFRKEKKAHMRNLKLTVRLKMLGTFIGASMTLRRVTSLELIYS